MDDDVNRAAANGSNTDVPSNLKLTRVTHHQLSKFQELQRRRLQLISKPKNKKFKAKGAKPKLQKEELGTKGFPDDNSDQGINVTNSNSHETESNEVLSSSTQVNIHPAFQKKKLHWGLDSKERWERKANM
ncbi:uncharacterized protein LOC141604419 [Silene latifolia]|uniref:uncharacterized protein LOC141604419 n=1 Tax=Silene latifolia TaxID=37657 RepID=UPI003D782EB1